MAPNQTRRRNRQPTARQQALLGELEELFLAKGFLDYTLDDLATHLRCSKSTLYALASSKEQLAVRVVTHFFRGAADRIEERVAAAADAPAMIREYLAGVAEELGRASERFIADVDAFEPTRETYEFNSRAAAGRIRGFIDTGARDGVFRDVHGPLVAEFAELLIEQIQNGTVRERSGYSDADAFAALSDLLLRGLRASSDVGDQPAKSCQPGKSDQPAKSDQVAKIDEPGKGVRR